MKYYLEALKKYAVFSGRSRRKEYWLFVLFNIIFSIVAALLDVLAGTRMENQYFGIISILFNIAMILPYLAVTVRRLHDTNRSGWWILISLIPIVGYIWLFVLMCLDGTLGENRFGLDPKRYENYNLSST